MADTVIEALFAMREAAALLQRDNKKSVAVSAQTPATSDCVVSSQLSNSCTKPNKGANLRHERDTTPSLLA